MRRIPGALIFAACLLGGCSDIPIPMTAPDPFSEVLLEYLHLPFVGRAEVTQWLGEPDATRMEGALAIYIEARERARLIPSNSSETDVHFLLVEYDEHDRVSSFDEIVDGGCTAMGFCIEARILSVQLRYTPTEVREEAVRNLVVSRAPGASGQEDELVPPADRCLLLLYMSADWHNPLYFQVAEGTPSYFLSPQDYLAWVAPPGPRHIHVTGSRELDLDLRCEAGETIVRRFDPRSTSLFHVTIDAVPLSRDEAAGEIGSRRLVVQ